MKRAQRICGAAAARQQWIKWKISTKNLMHACKHTHYTLPKAVNTTVNNTHMKWELYKSQNQNQNQDQEPPKLRKYKERMYIKI